MQVEIWSDINCPWCAIGKARLEQAVAKLDWSDEVEVAWRPFELDPSAPAEGADRRQGLGRKYGMGPDQVRAMEDRLSALGAADGVAFDWDRVDRRNTFAAHRVLAWALDVGSPRLQNELKGRLLAAHFAEGADVNDASTLARLAGEVGLDAEAAAEVLAGDAYAEQVRAEEQRARDLDITAVPTFVIGGGFAIPGAQEPETLRLMLERARERLAAEAAPPA